jgi:hypothetical protein
MAWNSPATWTNGAIVTDTDLNQQLRDNLRYLKGLDGTITIEDTITIRKDAAGATGASLNLFNASGGNVALNLFCTNTGANPQTAQLLAVNNNHSAEIVLNTKTPGAVTNANVQRLRVDTSGNMIVGTATSTIDKLLVQGSANLQGYLIVGATGAGAGATLAIGANATGNRLVILRLQSDATYADGFELARFNSGANSPSQIKHRGTGALILQATDAGSLSLQTTATERLGIDAGGNVTTPISLKVGSGAIAGGYAPQPFAVATNAATYCFVSDSTATLLFGADAAGSTMLGSVTSTPFHLRTGNVNRLTVTTDGKIGIGTTSPQGRLHVIDSAGAWLTWGGDVLSSNTSGNPITLVPSGVSVIASVMYAYKHVNSASHGSSNIICWAGGGQSSIFSGIGGVGVDNLVIEIVGGALRLYRTGSAPSGTVNLLLWIMYR